MLIEQLRRDAADDRALARVLVELLEQLQIGEAQAHGLDLHQDLVRPGPWHWLRGVEFQRAGTDELDGVLGFGELSGHSDWQSVFAAE